MNTKVVLPHCAGYLNPTVMLLSGSPGQRQTQSGATSFSRIERPEDVGQTFGRNATARIHDCHSGVGFEVANLNSNCPRTVRLLINVFPD